MREIDQYAYASKLRLMDPSQKILFVFCTLMICLTFNSILVDLVVTATMIYLTVKKGKTPFKVFSRYMLIPFSFLLISIGTIIVEIGKNGELFLVKLPLFGSYIGVTTSGMETAIFLFFKVIASIACLGFLSFSTPITDFLQGLVGMKCPDFLIELMGLIYRFIFVLLEVATTMHHAQSSRLGYKDFKTGIRSFGGLLSHLLLKALKINQAMDTALEARGYTGQIKVLTKKEYWKVPFTGIVLGESILIGIMLLEKYIG